MAVERIGPILLRVLGEIGDRKVAPAPRLKSPSKAEWIASAEFLHSFEWRKLRMKALLRYGARCMACGATPATGAVMNVDHVKPRKTHPELSLNLENLQILCEQCNHGKGNWDQTDWKHGKLP